MKRAIFTATISFLLSVVLIFGASAFAGSKEIKARMKARLPVINALKAEGIIGENNRGYLEFVGKVKKKEDVVSAENNDRRAVYQALGKRENVPAEEFGKLRAKNIAEMARSGEWLQDERGRWYRK